VGIPVHKTSQADTDLAAAIQYLLARDERAALKFVNDFEDLTKRLALFPELYSRQRRSSAPEWENVRMAVLRRFRYIVFYTYDDEIVIIRRVVHGARNEP